MFRGWRKFLGGMAVGLAGLGVASAGMARDDGAGGGPPLPEIDAPAELPAAEVILDDTPIPGVRLTIGPDGPFPPDVGFRWTQVEGPPVELDDPSAPRVRFTVPRGAERLVFRLAVTGPSGERSLRIVVPINQGPEGPAAPAASTDPAAGPTADAGDDQIGLVGRRITLNGGRSRPEGRVGYRWLQVAGPKAIDLREEGAYLSFTPAEAGVYRFALVVGLDNRVSAPDEVVVEVGQAPAAAAAAPTGSSPLARWAVALAPAMPGGASAFGRVAEAFEGVARSASQYGTFEELQADLLRRLDAAVPADAASRSAWASQVFSPLTQVTATELGAVGIDPRAASASPRPLDPSQRVRIQALYLGVAEAFRSASVVR